MIDAQRPLSTGALPAVTDPRSPENQRRYPRQELIHDATVSGDRIGELPCQIRDYCPGGMFLAWKQSGGTPPPLTRGDRVKVRFKVRLKGAGQRGYDLSGTVAWTFERGFGIAFEQLDSGTARILSKLAEATRARKERLQRTAPPHTGAGPIWQELQSVLDQHLEPMLGDLLRQVDEQLFQDAGKAASNVEQSEFFAAMKAIKRQREEISRQVEQQVSGRLEGLHAGHAADPGGEMGGGGLSLVDQEEFETFLALSSIIARLEQHYQKELFCIEQRLSKLSGGEVDAENNPFGVAVLLKSIARGFLPLSLGAGPTMSLIRSIETTVTPYLKGLYQETNEVLVRAGILPDLDYDRHQEQLRKQYLQRQKSTRPTPAEGGGPEAGFPPPGTVPPETGGMGAPGPAAEAAAFTHPPAVGGAMPVGDTAEGVQQTATGGSPAGPAAAEWTATTPPGTAGTTAPWQRHLGQALESMQSLLAATSAPPGGETGTPVPPERVARSLAVVQQADQANWAAEAGTSPTDMARRVERALGSTGAPVVLDPVQRTTVEAAGGLVSALAGDPLIAGPVRSGLEQLKLPLLRMAVTDPAFLRDAAHPARRLLNQLSRLDIAPGEEGRELRQLVEALLQRLAALEQPCAKDFSAALGEVDALIAAQQQHFLENMNEVRRACEEQQALVRDRRPPAQPRHVPRELEIWREQVRKLQVGDWLALRKGDGTVQRLALAWIGPDFDPYVFVDSRGRKSATMTLQELALLMRKGVVRLLESDELPASDRALQRALVELQEKINRQRLTEPRTGLPSREALLSRLREALEEVRAGGGPHSLALFDFACLEQVDRQWGSEAGDALLERMMELIAARLPDEAALSCLGGDLFGVLLRDAGLEQAREFSGAVIEGVRAFRFHWEHQTFTLRVSAGIAPVLASAESPAALLESAAGAAQEATGGVQAGEYEDTLAREETHLELDWAGWAREALEASRIPLWRQQLHPLRKELAEPPLGILRPALLLEGEPHFLPVGGALPEAIREQLPALEQLAIGQALAWLEAHEEDHLGECSCFLPISTPSLAEPALVESLLEKLGESRVPPARLGFWIDAASLEAEPVQGDIFMRTMQAIGCPILYSGSSSRETNPQELAVDLFGIDPVFVEGMAESEQDLALVRSLNEIAQLLGRRTVAFGADHEIVLEKLAGVGVDYAVGRATPGPRPLEQSP